MTLSAHATGIVLATAAFAFASSARGESLSTDESRRLARGETVVRESTWERGERRYVGGLTYTVLDASSAEIAAILEDVGSYRSVLPRTKRARLVNRRGPDTFVELLSGNDIMEAEYTIVVRRYEGESEFRFWLDPGRPHGIDDAWGFFRLAPFEGARGEPRVLLTYAILVDVGPGIVRGLFEERLRATILSVPQLLTRAVAEKKSGR